MSDTPAALLGDGAVVDDERGTRLVGGRCDTCGQLEFPARRFCRRCGAAVGNHVELSQTGRLLSAAVDDLGAVFGSPYAIAQVELADGVVVQGYLQGDVERATPTGTPVRIVEHDVPASAAYGGPYRTFAFVIDEPS